jgi:hypothetical protein
MKFVLRRGRQWIIAPTGDRDPMPPDITIGDDLSQAWQTPSLNIAIERQELLRICKGWATEIRTIKS